MSIKKFLLAATSAALLIGTVGHADEVGEWYVAPGAVFIDDDEDRAADDGLSGGQLTVGYAFADSWNIEFFGNALELDGFSPQDITELGINFVAVLDRESSFSPFLLAGISAVKTDFENLPTDTNSAAVSIGLGFLWSIGDSPFDLRGDYRLRKELGEFEFSDSLASLGLQVGFGGADQPIDSDGDGVNDDDDRCPNTPLGAAVDANGCELDDDGDGVVNSKDACPNTPAGASVDSRGCPAKDSDGDGVYDADDQCPNTPAGARVDENGCELDDDGDGVVNSKDRCPNTTAGVRVDVNGCEIKEVIELPGVTFASNSDRLLPGAEQVLDDAAATLRKYPDLVVEVAGHTDSDGAAAYNESLSERRAKTVMNYLVDRGANAANLTARGFGEAEPVADNTSAVGKAANRRVELRILNN